MINALNFVLVTCSNSNEPKKQNKKKLNYDTPQHNLCLTKPVGIIMLCVLQIEVKDNH